MARPDGHRKRMTRRRRGLGLALVSLAGTCAALVAVPQASASFVPGGLVSAHYVIRDAPRGGLTGIGFPVTVIHRPDAAGQYWAQQFSFTDGHGGYIGMASKGGGQAKFSVFGKGFTTHDARCRKGADLGSGVSCNINHPIATGVTYRLDVTRGARGSWQGWIVDTSTGRRTEIGQWTAPAGTGLLRPSGSGFAEYYLPVSSCASLPYAQVRFGAPRTLGAEGGTGCFNSAYAYGRCKGAATSSGRPVNDGVDITTGR
ncbi:hypothetical protein [Streptomyces sp. L2]|uniref:DUF3472 domain-containing protein n=1 Tax=Streptomyces sp. L2 TaxID=2162665 RepID=UPI0010116674|nr:hypothetical protein [Streptomyces sp. L2]